MSARGLRAVAELHLPADNAVELGQAMGLREAADAVDALAAKLEELAEKARPARNQYSQGLADAFREAAKLVRGDTP